MSTHSTLSPSSRYRWQLCPGSVRACQAYPEGSKSSPSAIEGTHTHTLLEHCLSKGIDPHTVVGTIMSDHEGEFSPTRDQADRVKIALDYIDSRRAVLGNPVICTERLVNPQLCLGRDDMAGTVDVQIFSAEKLELIDYKDGVNEVTAKDNPQLEQYFFGVVGEMLRNGNLPTMPSVRLTIIQPRMALKGGAAVSWHDYTMDEMLAKMPQIIAEAEATDDPNAPRIPGDKQCRYCVHKVNCAEFTHWQFDKAGVKFGAIIPVVEQTDAGKLDNTKLRELVEAAPLLRKLLEEAEDEAMRRIASGHPVPGLKVVQGPGRRSWAFSDEEMEAKLKRFGIPKGSIWKTSLISPAQVEKLKWEKRDKTVMQLTPKQLNLVETELIKRTDGKPTVVPVADRRPGIEYGDLNTMFKPVEQQAAPAVPAAPDWLS